MLAGARIEPWRHCQSNEESATPGCSHLGLDAQRLEQLAADRTLQTCERFSANDFYGHAEVLKQHAGLPAQFCLPGVYPHGLGFAVKVWDLEATHPLPNLLLYSALHRETFAKFCAKPAFLIGAPVFYAERLLHNELTAVRAQASGTVVFPSHSTHHVTAYFNLPEFIEKLCRLPAEYQPVEVCLYWRDIQLGRHQDYLQAGLACTTAGHIFDKEFMLRLVRILAGRRRALANCLGTSFLCAGALGLSVELFDQRQTYEGAPEFLSLLGAPSSSFARRLYEAAALPADERHVRIGELTRQGMGADAVMEPGPLKALLEDLAARINFKKLGKPATFSAWASATSKKALRSLSKRLKPLRGRPSDGHSPLARGSTSAGSSIEFSELNDTKARRTLRRGVDYERALHFLRRHQPVFALEAVKEELRYFPDHNEARTLSQKLARKHKPQAVSGDAGLQELRRAIGPFTMLGAASLESLYQLAKQVCEEDLPGNFVECGVAAGGSSALVAAALTRYSKLPRKLFACDTFDGMPEPSEFDRFAGVPANQTGWGAGTCAAPVNSLRAICNQLRVIGRIEPLKGLFAQTLPASRALIGPIAFLHLDCRWYVSTSEVLRALFDQVVERGRIQISDYHDWEGCRKAVTDFQVQHGLVWQINRIDEHGVWFTK